MNYPRRKLPPLNALRAFEVAGRRLNFRAAAEELGVTQGAVAQQVRGLEAHIGQPLFHRLPRGLALTPQGALYLAEVTRAFDALGEATARLLRRPETVTISVPPTFAGRMLIPRLPELQAACPEVELRTVATEALSDFDRDGVDIAVRMTRPPFPVSLEARLLFRQTLIAVASPNLVGDLPLPLAAERLADFPLLHDAHDHWRVFLDGVSAGGPSFNQTTLALDAAMAGQGIALACRAYVSADLKAGRLVQVSQRIITVAPDFYLVRKRAQPPRSAVDMVWNWCAAEWDFEVHEAKP